MPYRFERGKLYRMPTHFGPAPGPRQIPEGVRADPSNGPRKVLVAASFLTAMAGLTLSRVLPTGEPVSMLEGIAS